MEKMNFKHLYYQKKLCFLHKMLRSDNSIVASVMKFLYTVMSMSNYVTMLILHLVTIFILQESLANANVKRATAVHV